MLSFFRKYERMFFIIITFVIVVSFSFFGTYSTLQKTNFVEKTTFVAIDGTEVSLSELQQFSSFIATDNDDKILLGGSWGLNFLNDGVVRKDFLQSDLANVLAEPFLNNFKLELASKHQKEKTFSPYSHPEASFISAVNIWNVIAPNINLLLTALKKAEDPTSKEAFKSRIDLYLAEQKFPHTALRYTLGYQQSQFGWVQQDPNIDRVDLALFGYHTLNDWFGQRFINLVSEFIINAAIIAEDMGYVVSEDEAMAELTSNTELSFQQNTKNPNIGVTTANQYFQEQLRRMGLDKSAAVKIWRQIMLFRRAFHDVGSSVFVDAFTHKQIHNIAKESITGDLYQLPEHLRFSNLNSLEKFEIYLKAVSEDWKYAKDKLLLPSKFLTTEIIAKNYPDLVQKNYQLEVASVSKAELQTKVGIKETWEWEVKDENWEKLKKKFTELGLKDSKEIKERYVALDALNKKTRLQVDSYARGEIVEENPDWLTKTLQDKDFEKKDFSISKSGKNNLFPSAKDPKKLIELFDQYPNSEALLAKYTVDEKVFYKIKVVDATEDWKVLTFSEAEKIAVLDKIVETELEKYYAEIRETNREKWFDEKENDFKPFYQVKKEVTKNYFAPLFDEIKNNYFSQVGETTSHELLDEKIASLRFFGYMQNIREKFIEDSEKIDLFISGDNTKVDQLSDQFKLIKTEYSADRTARNPSFDIEEAFVLNTYDWTNVQTRANGNINFFQLIATTPGDVADRFSLYEKVMDTYNLVSKDSQKALMKNLLTDMIEKNALSLKFMDSSEQEVEE